MDYEEFFQEASEKEIVLSLDQFSDSVSHRLSNEALFHLPLLAMTILLLSKTRRKPKSDELGQLIGECFERTFSGFKGSSQHLGWSANLRMRTVKALTFLETVSLVEVDRHDSRIKATDFGKKVVSKAIDVQSDLGYTLQVIERNYFDLQIEKQIAMDLE
ncbi:MULTISPECIES: hypothetical protein [Halomonadaceae]|uniref:hypothetical protein n=1 Tax=Halomonadaceae TaxID=28256 RepID=UPI000C33C657|nr:hypothetical protein [Halomonas sp. MES3-P3E]PKG48716.1 hypothetical protein CXF87_15855 [Halomonas sp. MES3-P3E]|tara:strand:- start:2297 stop:2776 length:480 start_codon:yes stop_codon:yes gene_type:complete